MSRLLGGQWICQTGHILEVLGIEVDMFLARMRLGAKPGVVRPRSHLLLRVKENGAIHRRQSEPYSLAEISVMIGTAPSGIKAGD